MEDSTVGFILLLGILFSWPLARFLHVLIWPKDFENKDDKNDEL